VANSHYPNGFSGGVSIRGVPILNTYSGAVYWVDSTSGSDGNNGTEKLPFATIDYTVGRCTADKGDIIMVKPNHAETVSAAGGIALDVAGISVIGLGSGSSQPTITLDTAVSADVDVGAASITVDNIHFIANFADIAVILDVNATDFTCRNCRFTQAGVNLNAKVCIQDAAAAASNNITVEGCKAIMYDAANTHFINFAGTGTGHIVRDNVLHGDWGTMCIGGAGVITFCEITGNVIGNLATTADACVKLASTATGVIVGNHGAGGAAQANGFTATACVVSQNYYGVLAEDLSAILDPIAT
tara:strand:- start:95 stop:997 length:903 start_codon:yes stop_codon:yes gene_type:complete